jgi:hypothetical protein
VKHAAAYSALTALAFTTAGCTGHVTPQFVRSGIVTGIAAPCVGVGTAPLPPVWVSANRHGRAVATIKVNNRNDHGGHFKLLLPPGRYLVRARGSGDAPQVVILHPGEHRTVNFPNVCK